MGKNKSLRDKYKATSTKKMKQVAEKEDEELFSGGGSDFLKIEDGTNKFRLYPKHPNEDNFYVMRKVRWVSIEKEDGKMGRRSILCGKHHGGMSQDIIQAYVDFCKEQLDANDKDDKLKLKKITDWNGGLAVSTDWLAYADKIKSGESEFGLLGFKKSVRDALNNEAFVEDEDDPIEIDPFTDPEEGYPIIIKYNKDAKKAADYYTVTMAKKPRPLTDEQLEDFDKKTPLSQLEMLVYTKDMFDLALEGLRNFDEENEIELFETDEFQDIVESLTKEAKKLSGKKSSVGGDDDEEDDEEDEKPSKKSNKKSSKKPSKDDDEEDDDEEPPFDDDEEDDDEEPVKKPSKKSSKKPSKRVVDDEEDDDDEDEDEDEEKPSKKSKKDKKSSKKPSKDEDDEEDDDEEDDDEEDDDEVAAIKDKLNKLKKKKK